MSSVSQARHRGRTDAVAAYRSGQSPVQVETLLTHTARSLPSGDAQAYLAAGRAVRPQDLGEAVRARVAAGEVTDVRTRVESGGQYVRRGVATADVWHVALVVWFLTAITVLVAALHFDPASAAVIIACLGIGWTAGWWAPRRKHRARLAYLDELATPGREHRREAAAEQFRWTMVNLVCFAGGLLAEFLMLRTYW